MHGVSVPMEDVTGLPIWFLMWQILKFPYNITPYCHIFRKAPNLAWKPIWTDGYNNMIITGLNFSPSRSTWHNFNPPWIVDPCSSHWLARPFPAPPKLFHPVRLLGTMGIPVMLGRSRVPLFGWVSTSFGTVGSSVVRWLDIIVASSAQYVHNMSFSWSNLRIINFLSYF